VCLEITPYPGLPLPSLPLCEQRTIWRVNRTISRCATVKEALAVVEEMRGGPQMQPTRVSTNLICIRNARKMGQGTRI